MVTDKTEEQLQGERNKNKNKENYNKLHKEIKRKIKDTKEKWVSNRCEEIEELQKKNDSFNMHKKIKEMTSKRKSNTQQAT